MRAFLIALTLSLPLAAPVQARSTEAIVVHIPYSDLDLSTARGVAKLKARSERAIRTACTPSAYERLGGDFTDRQCMNDAMAEATQQIERRRQTSVAMVASPRS